MSVLIGRRINGIAINQLEYVIDEKGVPLVFENEKIAKTYLLSKGTKLEDLDYYEYSELPKDNIQENNYENIYEAYDKTRNTILNKVVKYDFFDRNKEENVFYDTIQNAFKDLNPEKANEELHELDMRNWLNIHNNIITEDIHEIEYDTYSTHIDSESNNIDNDVTKLEVKLSNSKDTNFLDLCSFTTKEGKLITKIDFIGKDINSKFFDSEGNEIRLIDMIL